MKWLEVLFIGTQETVQCEVNMLLNSSQEYCAGLWCGTSHCTWEHFWLGVLWCPEHPTHTINWMRVSQEYLICYHRQYWWHTAMLAHCYCESGLWVVTCCRQHLILFRKLFCDYERRTCSIHLMPITQETAISMDLRKSCTKPSI